MCPYQCGPVILRSQYFLSNIEYYQNVCWLYYINTSLHVSLWNTLTSFSCLSTLTLLAVHTLQTNLVKMFSDSETDWCARPELHQHQYISQCSASCHADKRWTRWCSHQQSQTQGLGGGSGQGLGGRLGGDHGGLLGPGPGTVIHETFNVHSLRQ